MNRNREPVTGNQGRKDTSGLRQALRAELLRLDFNAFERCVASLLTEMGYTDVHIRREGEKGRNRDGGWDIEAKFPTGLSEMRTIVQVKQYETTSVQKRYVDELRGGMVRAGAGQGLLVTLSTFPATAKHAAEHGAIAPIRLIDGDELITLMIAHGIGVAKNTDGRCEIDQLFFAWLRPAGHVSDPQPSTPASATTQPCYSVTVVVTTKRPRIEWKMDE